MKSIMVLLSSCTSLYKGDHISVLLVGEELLLAKFKNYECDANRIITYGVANTYDLK